MIVLYVQYSGLSIVRGAISSGFVLRERRRSWEMGDDKQDVRGREGEEEQMDDAFL